MCAEKLNSVESKNVELFVDLKIMKRDLYDKAGVSFDKLLGHEESAAYAACSFELNGKKAEHRSARITPAKQGMFVTIWKRNKEGITAPLDVSDDFDLLLITCRQQDKAGQFVFLKSVLVGQKVISVKDNGGKRGMRVYPPWDVPANDQVRKTQKWQRDHFIDLDDPNAMEKFNSILSRLH